MRAHHAVDGVDQVFRLQIGELLLLSSQLNVEQVVVQLCDQRLQRNAALHTRRTYNRCDDVARIHKSRPAGRRNAGLFKKA